MKYPSIEEVVAMLHQLTPHVYVVNASDMSMKHFATYHTTNPVLVGLALARGLLPLKKYREELAARSCKKGLGIRLPEPEQFRN